MPEVVEFDPVDTIAAGAVGEPGRRAFYIQATKEGATLTVLVEKQQVALLAERIDELLNQVSDDYPETEDELVSAPVSDIVEPAVPLFRASVMGIGFDPRRLMVVLEMYERGPDDERETDPSEAEQHIARLHATRPQMRAMTRRASEVVAAGRPPCPWCKLPLDPTGHVCPAGNGHRG